MCGILGAVGKDIDHEKMLALFRASGIRGTDATGVYVSNGGDNNKIIKTNLPADAFVKDKNVIEGIKGAKLVIGHTRNYTIGSPNNNANNHPLYSENIAFVHNGTCSSTPRIKDYPYLGQVDSELILGLIETKGLAGLRDVQGSASIAWSLRGDSIINLWRSGNPCFVAKFGDSFWFASTSEILKKALGQGIAVTETDEGYVYYVGLDKDENLIFLRGKEKYSPRGYQTQTWQNTGSTSGSTIPAKIKLSILVDEEVAADLAVWLHDIIPSIQKTDISQTLKPGNKMLLSIKNTSESEREKIISIQRLISLVPDFDPVIEEVTTVPAKQSTVGV